LARNQQKHWAEEEAEGSKNPIVTQPMVVGIDCELSIPSMCFYWAMKVLCLPSPYFNYFRNNQLLEANHGIRPKISLNFKEEGT
jgi:hypothetical protein